MGDVLLLDLKKKIYSSDYMVHKLGVDESVSLELCILLYKQYGTTMAGLRVCAAKVYLFFFFLYVLCCLLALNLCFLLSCYTIGCWIPV